MASKLSLILVIFSLAASLTNGSSWSLRGADELFSSISQASRFSCSLFKPSVGDWVGCFSKLDGSSGSQNLTSADMSGEVIGDVSSLAPNATSPDAEMVRLVVVLDTMWLRRGLLSSFLCCFLTLAACGVLRIRNSSGGKSGAEFGRAQSPINVITTEGHKHCVSHMCEKKSQSNPLRFHYPSLVGGCCIVNTGSTVQVNIPSGACSLWINHKFYELKQFHFHSPSEHRLDDRQYEMEMHLVHVSSEGDIAVLGFMFSTQQKGKKACVDKENPFLQQFFAQLPGDKCDPIPLKGDPLSFDSLFQNGSLSPLKRKQSTQEVAANLRLFEYPGSLTTPPFSEGVHWLLCTDIQRMTPEQLFRLSACWNHANNARACHLYHDRHVQVRSCSGSCSHFMHRK